MRLHSILSPKCEVRKSPIDGLGVFAKAPIRKDELVALWGGKIYSDAEARNVARKQPHFRDAAVSIYDGYCLCSTSLTKCDDAERFNHSCQPNIGLRGQIVVVARRIIRVDDELCFDYETTETQSLSFRCQCGAPQCRGRIDGTAWKDAAFQRRNRGYFSWYVAEKIKSLTRHNNRKSRR